MTENRFYEEGFFFMDVGSACRIPAATCSPDISVAEAARAMRNQNLAGLIVVEGDTPVGILSVRDLRDLVATAEGSLVDYKVGDIMHTGVITVRHNAYVFEAIFKMAKNNIHRLAVVDEEQNLVGMINAIDLLSQQTRSPLYLTQEIELAESIEELREINGRILDMVRSAVAMGTDIRSLVQLIAHFNDGLTERVIDMLATKEGISLPDKAAFLALGSEGRGEQTLRTDQDSALIYADDITDAELSECRRFADRLVASLEFIGIPRCPGNTMASNPQWQHSLTEWQQLLDEWISVPTGEHMVNFGMFQDFRTIHGIIELENKLHDFIQDSTSKNRIFFPYVAKNITRFPAPLGMFGRIKVERSGKNRGKVDLKKSGIFAITEGASLMALEHKVHGGTTWDKLDKLGEMGVLSTKASETTKEAFSQLVGFRLKKQLTDLASGQKPGNAIDPLRLPEKSQRDLREALRGVNHFLRIIRDAYRLDSISR